MEQLVEFLLNHWVLTVALFATVSALAWSMATPGAFGIEKVTPMDATRLINHEDAIVLDIREDGEFGDGHILNAIHIPQRSVLEQIRKLEKYRSKPIIAACRTGSRSASVCATLRKQGFERVYNLGGGVLAWQNANLPLVRK